MHIYMVMLLFGFMLISCQDEILVGSDLLDDNTILLDYTEQVQLTSSNIYTGPFTAFDSLNTGKRLVCLGNLDDNTFGQLRSELAISFNINSASPPNYPFGKKPLKFDSLVLVLTYDTVGTYGNINTSFRALVSKLENKLPAGDSISSDVDITYGEKLADTILTLKPKDSVRITNHIDGKSIKQLPQMRIRLSGEFGQQLLSDTTASKKDSVFNEVLKGVYIQLLPQNDNAMLGFNFSTVGLSSSVSNKMIMYYTESDTLKKVYNYSINRRFVNKVQRDFTGSLVEKTVQDSVLADKICYIQGFEGPKILVKMPKLDIFKDKIVNYVQLIVTADISSGTPGEYGALRQMVAETKDKNGKFKWISDIYAPEYLETVFGGKKVEKNGKVTYTMNITNHVKDILKDPTIAPELYLSVPNQNEYIQRSVIYGANHDQYKMRIKVNFTSK